jgi:hypothetical protein
MLGAAESPLGDREGGATAIFEKSGPPDSADPADFCNRIGQSATFRVSRLWSDLPLKADVRRANLHFCHRPCVDVAIPSPVGQERQPDLLRISLLDADRAKLAFANV